MNSFAPYAQWTWQSKETANINLTVKLLMLVMVVVVAFKIFRKLNCNESFNKLYQVVLNLQI